MAYISYKNLYSFDKRLSEATRILTRYPDRIPIICEKAKNQILPHINKNKYLVTQELTIGHFICVIRKRLHLPPEFALFILVDGYIPSSSTMIADLYEHHKHKDGFLYIEYCQENTFGYEVSVP